MKKLFIIMTAVLVIFACNKNETKQGNSAMISKKAASENAKSEKDNSAQISTGNSNAEKNYLIPIENLEGIYQAIDNCGINENIKIRKIKDNDAYLVEFGSIKNGTFLTREGFYSYFSIKNYPNIEFSCPTGRIRETFQDSNTLDIYNLQIKKEGNDLFLSGIVFQVDMNSEKPILYPYRDEKQNIFKRVHLLPKDASIKFFTLPIESVPVYLNITKIDEKSIICNSKELKFKEKYETDYLRKEIGAYSGSDEIMGRLIVIYPNLELYFNEQNNFIGFAKDFKNIEELKAFGFTFSYKTKLEELEQFAQNNFYQTKKESEKDHIYYDIFIKENIEIHSFLDPSKKNLKRMLVVFKNI